MDILLSRAAEMRNAAEVQEQGHVPMDSLISMGPSWNVLSPVNGG